MYGSITSKLITRYSWKQWHLYKQMSWTGELFCHLRVTVHRAAYWQIWQFVIGHRFAHCRTWDKLFDMITVWYIYYDHRVWYRHEACMVEGKSYTFGENLYLCERQIGLQVFYLLFTDNTITNWFQLDSNTIMYSRRWTRNNCMSHISPKTLQDNPVSSKTPV